MCLLDHLCVSGGKINVANKCVKFRRNSCGFTDGSLCIPVSHAPCGCVLGAELLVFSVLCQIWIIFGNLTFSFFSFNPNLEYFWKSYFQFFQLQLHISYRISRLWCSISVIAGLFQSGVFLDALHCPLG